MGPWVMLAAAVASPAPEAVAPNASPPNAATPDSAARGVIPYPPSFFAESRPVNAYDMVVRLPGFTFDKGATVRGLSGAGGNVLIDGQPPVSKNDALDEILKRIPAGAVERVELIRGGAPGIDMEGRTVLANIVRKQTAGFRAAVMPGIYQIYDGRQLPGVRVEAQWRWPGGRSAEFGQVYGTGPNDEFGDGRRTRYNPDGSVRLRSKVDADAYGLRAWTTGAYETPLFGGRARINGAFMLTPAEVEIYDRYETAAGGEYEKNEIDRLQAELGGRFNRGLTERLSLEAVGFHQWNNQKTTVVFEAPGLTRDFLLDRKTTEAVGRLNFRYRASPALTLEAGGEGALNNLDSETRLAVNGRPVPVPAANVQVEEKRADAFLRGSWRPMPTLTLEAGVRQEVSRVTSAGDVTLGKTLTFTKPRAAVTWAADPSSQVRLRVEREVGQLNFDDFVASPNVASTGVVVAGNPDLTPQQAWVFEAAYERRFWGAGAAVMTVRHFEILDTIDRGPARDASGTIIRDPVTGQPAADRPDNIGESTKDEVQASLTVPLDRFGVRAAQLRGQVTKRWTKVDDPLLGGTREVSALRPIDWEAHFSQDLPRWNATWGVDVFGGFRERYFRLAEIETRKFSPWVVVYGEYKPQPDWILRLEAMGVTSRNVRRIREVYSGPRNAFPLDYTDVRSLEWDGSLYLRVRKTFGS
ncbi:TonB-dependent receptor [Phenylobacterium sp. SCN 70-31]|uniref:TonB-dependent receptor plug domain-containing protein n=1 Tax=Phenylobacterium sp. SCN 70-31 TaxID=1660129 RepID=UPI000AEB9680|nr:TonB-dependent receptor [Phenylobacterium sp. SCN 70-31]